MPSWLHEGLIHLFRERPEILADMLAEPLAVDVPDYRDAEFVDAGLTNLKATEYRADGVVVLTDAACRARLGIVVEVQLGRDKAKRTSWPCYVVNLRARLRCPVALLVICPDEGVGRWCGRPIPVGPPGSVITPVVLGPDQIPLVTDLDEALAYPELTVLSAIASGRHPEHRRGVYEALVHLMNESEEEMSIFYSSLVAEACPADARQDLEDIMAESDKKYRDYGDNFISRYVNHGRAEGEAVGRAEGEAVGRAEGEANAIITVLTTRGIAVPDAAHQRITSCSDLDQLEGWLKKAALVDTVDELFS